jgi:hypothetical protein
MTDAGGPAPGEMQLYDAVLPPLEDGVYNLHVQTTVTGGQFDLPATDAYFSIEGPRFALPASEVAAVHPPRNAQGSFDEVLPHIVLGRRTLPWERELDPHGLIADPPPDPDQPEPRPLTGPVPWLALLVFVDDPGAGEATVITQVPLTTVVTDATVLANLGVTGTELVDAVEAPGPLLRRLLPTKEEASLLCHARRVNVDDRVLGAGDSDGWFAVVMANRLPVAGHRHRACLVTLEQRSDLIPVVPFRAGDAVPPTPAVARLVLLHSWTFTAAPARTGTGSFRELAEGLNSGLAGLGATGLTATGHIPLPLHERTGDEQAVLYRGPLAPAPTARDPLGPYHSADQAIRVSPDAGAQDISYAAAFELGRLLAAADPRLGQELMRWRREAYRESARSSVAATVWNDVPKIVADPPDALQNGMVAPVSVTVLERAGAGAGASADTTGLQAASSAPGLDPVRLAAAWRVTPEQAHSLLTGAPAGAAPGPAAGAPAGTPAAADAGLATARDRIAATEARPTGDTG